MKKKPKACVVVPALVGRVTPWCLRLGWVLRLLPGRGLESAPPMAEINVKK